GTTFTALFQVIAVSALLLCSSGPPIFCCGHTSKSDRSERYPPSWRAAERVLKAAPAMFLGGERSEHFGKTEPFFTAQRRPWPRRTRGKRPPPGRSRDETVDNRLPDMARRTGRRRRCTNRQTSRPSPP